MRQLVLVAMCSAGCTVVFPLEEPPLPRVPVQSVTATTTHPPLVAQISPTTDGNALVAAVAVATFGAHLDGITDDAGNVWMRALDGVNSVEGPGRVEIWYVLGARPITSVTLGVDKGVAIDLMEWSGLAGPDTPPQAHAAVTIAAPATAISTGTVETQTAGLVVGISGCAAAGMADLESTDFTAAEFLDIQTSPTTAGNVAFAIAEPGTHEVTWTQAGANGCTAGIVAIPAAP